MCDQAMKDKIVDLETRVERLERILEVQALAWKKFSESVKIGYSEKAMDILKDIPVFKRSPILTGDE